MKGNTIRALYLTSAVLATLLTAGCEASNADSQALYIQATTHADKAIQDASSYSEALAYYQDIQTWVGLILKDASSPVALDMAAGRLPLGGLSLHVFRSKESMLYELADAENSLTKAALQVASTIEDEADQQYITYQINMAHLEEVGVEVIERFIEANDSLDKQLWAMTGLIEHHVNAGNFDEAAILLEQSFALADNPENQLGASATYRGIINQTATALEVAPPNSRMLDRLTGALININDEDDRYSALVSLGRLSLRYGDRDHALDLLAEAQANARYVVRDTPYWGDNDDIRELMEAYLLAQAPERAETLIVYISDEMPGTTACQILSEYYRRLGNKEKAISALSSALGQIRAWGGGPTGQHFESLRLWELSSIAEHYASLGHIAEALTLHEEVSQAARTYDDWRKYSHATHLARMVNGYMEANLTEEAARMYGELVSFTEGTNAFFRMGDSHSYKVHALMVAARAFAAPDTMNYAQRAFSQALRFTLELDSPSSQANMLSQLSLLLKEHSSLEPREQDWELVRTIIQTHHPIRTFWQ